MKSTRNLLRGAFASLSALAVLSSGAAIAAGDREDPVTLEAANVLPSNVVAGPHHRVRAAVRNDGFLNIYTIDSKYGPIEAVSTDILYKRIGELNAMAGMEKIRATEEFNKGLKNKAGDFVEGGVSLIKDPVGSVSGAVSGVASIFRSVSATVEYGKSDTESGRMSVLTGFDKTKREYAAEFNVDVYSRNPYLQKELNDLSRAGFLGTSIVRVGTAVVGGAAGMALTVTGNVDALNDLLRAKSAGDLRVMNAQTLKKIGVSGDVIDLFLMNRVYTLTEQTALVLALDSMQGTTNRAGFVKFAALVDNADMAGFRRRQAEMYAAYNHDVAPIAAFEFLGLVAVARTKSNLALFSAPLDHMLWTTDLASYVAWLSGRVDALANLSGKELRVAGTVSAMTRQEMEKMGWKIDESVPAPARSN